MDTKNLQHDNKEPSHTPNYKAGSNETVPRTSVTCSGCSRSYSVTVERWISSPLPCWGCPLCGRSDGPAPFQQGPNSHLGPFVWERKALGQHTTGNHGEDHIFIYANSEFDMLALWRGVTYLR